MSTLSGLDELFARKDRRRSKKCIAMLSTPEDVARKLDEAAERNEQRIRKEQMASISTPQPIIECENQEIEAVENGEWGEFGENKRDYTGLKIGHLTSGDAEQYSESDKLANLQESTIPNEEDIVPSVWKKINPQIEEEKKIAEAKTIVTEKKVKGYVPPHLRVKMKQSAHNKTERINRTAPDINNEQFFPTLTNKR